MPTAIPKAFLRPDAIAALSCPPSRASIAAVYAALGPASSRYGTLAAIVGWNNIFLPEHCTSGVRLVQFILKVKGIQISGTKK
jgi:hypothetical protein